MDRAPARAGRTHVSAGLTVIGAILVMAGVIMALIGEAMRLKSSGELRSLVSAGELTAAAGLGCGAVVILIAAAGATGRRRRDDRQRGGYHDDLSGADQYPDDQYPDDQYPDDQYPDDQYPDDQWHDDGRPGAGWQDEHRRQDGWPDERRRDDRRDDHRRDDRRGDDRRGARTAQRGQARWADEAAAQEWLSPFRPRVAEYRPDAQQPAPRGAAAAGPYQGPGPAGYPAAADHGAGHPVHAWQPEHQAPWPPDGQQPDQGADPAAAAWSEADWSDPAWSDAGWSDDGWSDAGWSDAGWSEAGWTEAGWSDAGWTQADLAPLPESGLAPQPWSDPAEPAGQTEQAADTSPLPVIVSPVPPRSAQPLPAQPEPPRSAGPDGEPPPPTAGPGAAQVRGPFDAFDRSASAQQSSWPAPAEIGAGPVSAKLEKIKDLYLTAEAIGEEALTKHFDELSTRQHQLIQEYFAEAGFGQDGAQLSGGGPAQNEAPLPG